MTATIHARFRCAFPGFDLDVDLTLPGTGITALFGHSGCGKTTLLRCMAGLQNAPGTMTVLGEPWQTEEFVRPVHKRALAYVFQETQLFPHLNVRRNLEFGYRRIPAGERQIRFDDAVRWLGLESLLERMPAGLSGGERQRVAIARALLTSPRLLLMDEPLSALDRASKQDILPYLERLRDTLAIPIIYVSHSTPEVARLADHIVMMEDGRVVAQGPLQETLARTNNPFRLEDDAGVLLEGRIDHLDPRWHLALFRFDGGQLWLRQDDRLTPGDRVRVQVLARDISLALAEHSDQSIQNLVPAIIDQVDPDVAPGVSLVRLLAGPTPLLSRLTTRSVDQLGLEPGKTVWMQIKSVALVD
ncbi:MULTISPECIES: molybdenum ABC transporter ATP-binding protein [Marinobacter]|jgi:molybdate transport system ATP-binding protein|uniref:Molybdate transport system ATP-binding protein n=3 Tax=Marinobacter TaxID=2742 RepID=A0A1W6K5L4_9GAMM|nr:MULTISPECIES: molybdenum ABC transporter ATP-binding protein [Marinobacter]MBL83088.1 molybdenum ABC transporter ATP-binding protein [Marinobacter sp.]ARM82728.1 spermidine/putrescine import ATP-binding protein PotA [Marinobacter salarius]AZR41608.1 molybdate-transporting ATPase [Marinobacter salarius]KXJ46614.1 MAG: molybdenum ABC transporter ATP-binding protein [Marinobacter sp. Hex_13]MBS8231137.1 molybdenum ABC transporter ATP-binding protein [Marinobacter salarius]|tara:strand:- start:1397 stop:2473 length:1077 start_codon:yes stop_codon:yes gene_type:complete